MSLPHAKSNDRASPVSRSIFISYSRRDAKDREVAARLAADLERRGRHEVWFDRKDIEAGGLYDVRIEQGVRHCEIFVFLLTRNSVSEDSFCRNELALALNAGKRVVPLRAEADPDLPLPVQLVRMNWIDLAQNYDEGLEALLRCLLGDESAMLRPLEIPEDVPLDFEAEIARFSVGFSGRQWVERDVDAWLHQDHAPRGFVIVAEPGLGKSSIAAFLARRRDLAAVYFCTSQNSRSLDPQEFVASLARQLCARLPAFGEALRPRQPRRHRRRAIDGFRELIVEPLRALRSPRRPWFMIVDSLDEATAQRGETILDVVLAHLPDFPPWFHLLATTRPEVAVLRRVQHLKTLQLEADSPRNRRDLESYIRSRLKDARLKRPARAMSASTTEKIEAIADGNFLCARLLLDSLAEGSLAAANLQSLAPGLSVFFLESFRRKFPDGEVYRRLAAPVLGVLLAARVPLPESILSSVVEGKRTREPCASWLAALHELRVYLRETLAGDGASFMLFHKALADWLADPRQAGNYFVSVAQGHRLLADYAWQEYRETPDNLSDYTSQHLAIHFAEAERWEELLRVVRDRRLKLLERWTERQPQEGIKCLQGLIGYLEKPGGDRLLAAGFATQLARIYSRRDLFEKAETWLEHALKSCRGPKGRRTRAIAYHELGSLALYRNDCRKSEELYRRALRLCETGRPRFHDEAAANLVALAVLSLGRYDYARAGAQAGRALNNARKSGDASHVSAANRLLANVAKDHLRFAEATEHLQAAALVANRQDLPFEKAAVSHLQGWLNYQQAALEATSPEPAIERFQKAREEAARIGHLPYGVGALLGLVQCHLLQASLGPAERYLAEAEQAMRNARPHADLDVCRRLARASVALKKGAVAMARDDFRQTANAAHTLAEKAREADAWAGAGAAEFHLQRIAQAERYWKKAGAVARQCSPLRLLLVQQCIAANRAGNKCTAL